MKLGLSTYTYTWAFGVGNTSPANRMTAQDLIQTASSNNVPVVQVADNFPLHTLSAHKQNEIKQMADDHGVEIEVGSRGLTKERILEYLDVVSRFESPFLRFVIDEKNYEPDLPQVIDVIQENLEAFYSYNTFLAIENHDRFTCKELIHIIHQTDPNRVGICLDSVNSLGAGEGIQEVMTQLIPYALNFHIKDFVIQRLPHQMGFEVAGKPAGQGFLDLVPIVNQLKNFQRCLSCTLELWTPPEADLEATIAKEKDWANQSLQYLQGTGKFTLLREKNNPNQP